MNSGISRILEEFRDNVHNPISSILVVVGLPDENNPFNWRVSLLCPNESPYKGGLFFLSLVFPQNYLFSPPEVIYYSYLSFKCKTYKGYFRSNWESRFINIKYVETRI